MQYRTPFHGLVLSSALFTVLISPSFAQAPKDALSGQVSSSEEGAMEGVVVSAKKDGSTITVSVVTDAKGQFHFPASRLENGRYTLSARAAGYDLDGAPAAVIAGGKTANAAVRLKKTQNLPDQMNNAEWLISMPGTEAHKKLMLNCISCHMMTRIVKSTHDTDGFLAVFERMSGYYPGSTPELPQRLKGDVKRANIRGTSDIRLVGDWLSSVNLSKQKTWNYPLKVLPRLKGASTRVIYTEYDLPRALIQPHDVVLDKDGIVWYSDFGQMFLGRMDPKTGKVTEFPIPVTKQDSPRGTLDLEIDREGKIWVGVMYQASVARFDPKTEKFRIWSIPKEWDSDAAQLGHLAVDGSHVDGKVWIKNSDGSRIYRLDPATGAFEDLGAFMNPMSGNRIGSYGIHSDSKNNLYLLDYSAGYIGKLDAKTKKLTVYATPSPNSRPRRGRVDAQDRIWFAEYYANAVGMLDPATGLIKEWKLSTPWSAPYDAVYDNNGYVWTGSMLTDRVARLDVKSGTYVEYPLPRSTNIRRVALDPNAPSTLWIGNNHGASIVKVEPLD